MAIQFINDLSVTGNATFSTTGVTDNIVLTSTDTSASSAPDLVLYRNAAVADSDTLGVVEYKGKNGMVPASGTPLTYNAIYSRIADASNNQSILTFSTHKGNGSGAFVHSVNVSAIGSNNSATGAILINPSNDFELPAYNLDVKGTGNFTGLVSGITPVAAANFVTKAYADGLTPGSGVFLPLAGGTMTGAIDMSSNSAILLDNSNNNNQYYIRNGGTSSATFQIGTGSPGSNIKLTMNGDGDATFAGNVTIDNSSPEFFLTPDSAKYSWMIAAQENVDQHFEITPSTAVGGSTFNAPAFKIDGATSNATFAGSVITVPETMEMGGNWIIQGTDGSYFQRIKTIDSSGTDAETFSFDVKLGSAASYKQLLVLNQDDSIGGTFLGNLTVSGGNITLGGTGRIQGVDTVTDATDATNKSYVDAAVTSIGGPFLELAGGTMTGNTIHNDNVKSIYGTASDGLEIYHDGSNSYISDSGTGNLLITSDGASVQINKGSTENMAEFIVDGAVNLYYDSAKKLETTSTGISVTGDVTAGESQNGTSFIKATNTNSGVSATARLIAVGETSQIDIIATSAGYTGVSGWADSGVISTDSGASGGLILNSVAGVVKLQTSQTTALTLGASQNATFAGDVIINNTKLLKSSNNPTSNYLDFDDDTTTHNPDSNVTTLGSVSGIALATNLNDGGGGTFTVSTGSSGTRMLTVETDGDATFVGDILLSHTGSAGQIIRTTDNNEPYFALQRNTGSNGVGVLRLLDGGDLAFDTGATGAGQSTRLTIDGATGNATFTGLVSGITPTSANNFATKQYVDDNAGGGTVESVTSGNTSTITMGGTSADPTVAANTGTVSASSSNLATGAQIQTAINTATTGALKFVSEWDASGLGGGGSPDLTQSSTHIPGSYYIVSAAGSATPNGSGTTPSNWAIGDWCIRADLATDTWQKIDNTQVGNVQGSRLTTRGVAVWTGINDISSTTVFITSGSNLEAGTTTATQDRVIRSLAGDGYKAGFEAYGNSQGTGYVYVGQSTTYGGGMFYNGDGSPAFPATGESSDTIAFYRKNGGTNEVVFYYGYSSNHVYFRGGVDIGTITAATVDTDKFLVSNSGEVMYRTGAQVRSDIGAGTSSLTLGTTSTTALAGNTTTITSAQAQAIIDNTAKTSDTGVPAITSNGSTPSLNSGITAAEVRSLIGAGTSSTTGNVTTSGLTAGRVSFATSGTNIEDQGNFTYNNSTQTLDVNGLIQGAALSSENTRVSTSQQFPVGHYSSGEVVWEMDPTWSDKQLQDYFNSSGVSWVEVADAPGGWCIYVNGGVNVGGAYNSGFPFIPVETDSADGDYYMECYIQNVGNNQSHYMGSTDFNESFGSLGGNPGSYGYFVMSNTNPGQSWTKVSGYIGGFHATQTGRFELGTKYWTPQALLNYGAGTGTRACRISGWKVIKTQRSAGIYKFPGSIRLTNASNASTDTDKFAVLDSNNAIRFRTGAQVRSDIGASSSNDFLTGLSFNTSNGVLTATVANQTNPTVDLDGRYFLSSGGTIGGAVTIEGNVFMDDYNITSVNHLDFGFSSGYIEGSSNEANFNGLSVKIGTIANATSDTDKFLVSDSGVIKYRTGAELRSDIGAGTGSGSMSSWIIDSDSGSGTITNGATMKIAGGTNITTSESGGVVTANFVNNSGFITSNSVGNATISLQAGTGLTGGGSFTTNQNSNQTIIFNASGGGGTVTGTGVSGRVAFWNSSTGITSEPDFLWSGQTLTLGSSANASEYTIELGRGRTNNGYAYIDLVGDATYTDYGLRLIRNNGGANTSSEINHRGTGNLAITTQDNASFKIQTNGANERLKIRGNGETYFGPDGASTSTLYIDPVGRKVGFRTETPGSAFDVNGTFRARNELNIGATTEQNFFVAGSSPYYVKMGYYQPGNADVLMGGDTVGGLCRSTTGFGSNGKVVMDTRYYTTKISSSGWPSANGGSNGVRITPTPDSDQLMIVKSIYITRQGFYNTSSWGSDTYPVQFVQKDSQNVYQIIGAVGKDVLTQSAGVAWAYEAYGNISQLNNPQNERQGWLGQPVYLMLSGTNLSNSKPIWFVTVQYSLVDNDIRKANVDQTL